MFSYLYVCVGEIILKFRWPVSLNVCAEKGREKEGVPKTWSSPGERVKWCVCVCCTYGAFKFVVQRMDRRKE